MTIFFSDEEMKWIEKALFKWTVKKDCPKNIKADLQTKIAMLYDKRHYGKD